MSAGKTTNYYIPGSSSSLYYSENEAIEKSTFESSEEEDLDDSGQFKITGIYDAAKQNNDYIKLLDYFELNDKNDQELKKWIEYAKNDDHEQWGDFDEYQFCMSDVQKQVVLEFFYWRRSKHYIMNNYPITNDDFNRVIRSFNKWIKIRRKYNKRFLNKKTKLSDDHINFIQSKVNT